MKRPRKIAIIGGGLTGSLLSVYLAKRGYNTTVFERRSDIRHSIADEGRSINLALSNRGLRPLAEVGLEEEIRQMAIPMHGRMMHDRAGNLSFLPYGKQGQFINSISRAELNKGLINHAEKHGVTFHFQQRCTRVDLEQTCATFESPAGTTQTKEFDLIIGADGAFSAVRSAMQITDRFDYEQHFLGHGYKELHIPSADGQFALEKNALHIWPRESYMMIALPNPDGSFTGTLFYPFEGRESFAALSSDENIFTFFRDTFPDATDLMPGLAADYRAHPVGSLVTIKCFPWARNNTLLIGDAAHAIVPFYGQGMNAGFEDCRVLNRLLDECNDDWPRVLQVFQKQRKEDADAIATLAFDNFIEMRDHVADPAFLLRKKIEAKLHDRFPDRWIPLYSMVTFHDEIRYSEALKTGRKQEAIMDSVMKTPDISSRWEHLDLDRIVRALD